MNIEKIKHTWAISLAGHGMDLGSAERLVESLWVSAAELFGAGTASAAPAAAVPAALPPLDEDLIDLLGRPNFACAGIADALRADGHDIKRRSENEQAATLYWCLDLRLRHGAGWREVAATELNRIAHDAASEGQEGGAAC